MNDFDFCKAEYLVIPGEEDARLACRGEEAVLYQRKVTVVFCEQLHPSFVSAWCSAGLRHKKC